MADDQKDKVALVTGAGRGIGRSIALGLAASGVRVALLSRTQSELEEVAREVRDLGGTASIHRADVGDRESAISAAKDVLNQFGKVDILVNNAAVVWPIESTATVDLSDWMTAITINVMGPMTFTHTLLPQMLEQRWGRIINISSGVAVRPAGIIGGNAYITSKAALEGHTLNLAAELAGTGLTVNAYRPGPVDTSMQGWIRNQPPEKIGADLHARFNKTFEEGALISPAQSAQSLLDRISSDATGEIWSFHDA